MLTVFIGYDSREDIAYRVCRESILKHSSLPVRIIPIKQDELREDGVYLRPADPLSSTEFSFTRFLVPHLAGYKGWAVFVDCDFLFRHDIYTVMKYRDPKKALFCVKHDYKPTEETKMDGAVQHQYPRKNWSSFMLFNCEHPDTVHLRPRVVNTATGMYLHQMQWTDNENIGELPISFNYLEGWHTKDNCVDPIAVHFTRGGPWFDNWQDVEYADEWLAVKKEFEDDQSN
jgi:lipopolysaccharide biosynthesis glycosyltransferase